MKIVKSLLALAAMVVASASLAQGATIGASYMTLNNIFFDPMNAAARQATEEAGAEYVVVDARLDISRQITGVENLLVQGVAALILNPVDSDAIAPAVLAANEAGVPVVTVDVATNAGDVISHVTSDNTAAGRLAGEFVVSELGGSGEVGIVDGPPITTFQQRVDGFTAAVEEAGLTVGAHLRALENSPEAFADVAENMITANPNLEYVFTVNDVAAMAAMAAIEASGRDDVFIVSVDGAPDAVEVIASGGAIKATVGQQPAEMGRIAVETALRHIRGESVDALIPAPLELVTQQNASGFSW